MTNLNTMKKVIFMSVLFGTSILLSCNEEVKQEAPKEEAVPEVVEKKTEEPAVWSYDGESSPKYWAELEKTSACGGSHQSPIDIVTADLIVQDSELKPSDIHYHKSTTIHDIINNGHSIQYNFDDMENYVDYKGKRYDLVQFHFHAASEHTVNGMHYPLVIHLVHVSEDKEYVVFAIMVEEGVESTTFKFLEEYLPVQPDEKKTIGKPHSFNLYMLEEFDHYFYQGSLTTPPCTEAVNWIVFKNPITASAAQVKALADLMPRNNFRPTQPLNDRKVYISE